MALAIFDLDNTLIAGDSDHAWGAFLVEKGVVDADTYEQKNNYYYDQYNQGLLNIDDYVAFALNPLSQQDMAQLNAWHQEFMARKIKPMLLPKAEALLQKHRDQGDRLLIITSTNDFVTAPICRALGVEDLIATEAEIIDNRYTGKTVGTPSFKEGKITRLNTWLATEQLSLAGSYGYSDSINDLPLLSAVDQPFVVDGDESLVSEAHARNWPCISLR